MNVIIRVLGTAAVTGLLTYPLWAPQWGAGLLGEVAAVPWPGNLVIVLVFLGLVALYCATLERLMRAAGAARPASVWWMFAIPANFVEDFYIIGRVASAIADRVQPAVLRRWLILGYGWCGFQILSLFPGWLGLLGGVIAIPLWLAHWMLARRLLT